MQIIVLLKQLFHEQQTTNDLRVVTGQTRTANNVRINTAVNLR